MICLCTHMVARGNCGPQTVRLKTLCRPCAGEGGGTLCRAPCAGSPWSLWGLEVCPSKKHNKTKRIHYFCHYHGSHAWNFGEFPVTQLEKCAPLLVRLRSVLKNRTPQMIWKIDCIYVPAPTHLQNYANPWNSYDFQ